MEEQKAYKMKKILNYIDGELIEPINGEYLDNFNPSTGKVYSLVPDSDQADINKAVKAAQIAYNEWSQTSKEYRSEMLLKLANILEERTQEFIEAESRDNGKPETLAEKVDLPRAITNLRFFASAILHDSSEMHEMDGKAINYTLRKPIGVAACISAWNLPIYLLTLSI